MRFETYVAGEMVEAIDIDIDTGTYAREMDGLVVETRPLTADEIAAYAPPPNAEADAYDALADVCDASPIASTRDLAPHYRVLAAALRSR